MRGSAGNPSRKRERRAVASVALSDTRPLANHVHFRQRLLQFLDTSVGHLGAPQIEGGQSRQLRQVLQAPVADLGVFEAEHLEPGQAAQVFQRAVSDAGAAQVERPQIGQALGVGQPAVG